VTYTGFVNTLGAYSTERLVPAAPADPAAGGIGCETAAGDDHALA
jgi:NADPH2:quinone reductase